MILIGESVHHFSNGSLFINFGMRACLLFYDPPLETAVKNCSTVPNMEACAVRCGDSVGRSEHFGWLTRRQRVFWGLKLGFKVDVWIWYFFKVGVRVKVQLECLQWAREHIMSVEESKKTGQRCLCECVCAWFAVKILFEKFLISLMHFGPFLPLK